VIEFVRNEFAKAVGQGREGAATRA
jgi:hypothetical protein